MMEVIILGLAFGFIALAIGYAHACTNGFEENGS